MGILGSHGFHFLGGAWLTRIQRIQQRFFLRRGDSCALFVWVGHKFVVFDLWCVIFVGWGDWCVGVSGEGRGDANDCINKFAIFNVGRW